MFTSNYTGEILIPDTREIKDGFLAGNGCEVDPEFI